MGTSVTAVGGNPNYYDSSAAAPDPPAPQPEASHSGGFFTRAMGVLQGLGGVFEVVGGVGGGVLTSETGVGAVAGGLVAAHGVDDIQAGFRQAWSGTATETLTQQAATSVAKSAGASPQTAAMIGIGVDLAAGGMEGLTGKGAAALEDVGKLSEVKALAKGARPDPATYLSKAQIEQHLAKFEGGASRITSQAQFNKYGIAQRDGTSFVMSSQEVDKLLETTKGNPRALEEALGLPKGQLDTGEMLRVDISNPKDLNLRMPSGNEAGANEFWQPGGLLPNGMSEAIIDASGAKTTTSVLKPQ